MQQHWLNVPFSFFCESTLTVRVPLPQRPPQSLSTIPYGSLPPLEKMCHWNANPERRQNRGSHGRGTTGGYSQARGTANLLCSVRGQKEIFVCRHLVPDVSLATNCCVRKKKKKKKFVMILWRGCLFTCKLWRPRGWWETCFCWIVGRQTEAVESNFSASLSRGGTFCSRQHKVFLF